MQVEITDEQDKRRKYIAVILIGLCFGFVLGIAIGYISFKAYITQYAEKCSEKLIECVDLYNDCQLMTIGGNAQQLNYFNITAPG